MFNPSSYNTMQHTERIHASSIFSGLTEESDKSLDSSDNAYTSAVSNTSDITPTNLNTLDSSRQDFDLLPKYKNNLTSIIRQTKEVDLDSNISLSTARGNVKSEFISLTVNSSLPPNNDSLSTPKNTQIAQSRIEDSLSTPESTQIAQSRIEDSLSTPESSQSRIEDSLSTPESTQISQSRIENSLSTPTNDNKSLSTPQSREHIRNHEIITHDSLYSLYISDNGYSKFTTINPSFMVSDSGESFSLEDITVNPGSSLTAPSLMKTLEKRPLEDITVDPTTLLTQSSLLQKVPAIKDNKPNFYSPNNAKLPKNYEQDRLAQTINLRIKLATNHSNDLALLYSPIIKDKYINLFSKGLPHDREGFVSSNEMEKLLSALRERNLNKLSEIKLGGTLKLVNPSAAWSNDIIGSCNNVYRFSKLPDLSSDKIAADMTELYCMSLSRDIPFREYRFNSTIDDCCEYLNYLKFYPQVRGRVTPYNIFRGVMDSDLQGPYISQFLYRDINMGGFMVKQKYTTKIEGKDYMKTWDTAISAQSGNILETSSSGRIVPRYIITGRDLCSYVHQDDPYQSGYNACMILMDLKVPMNIPNDQVEGYFVNLGRADIQCMLGMAGRSALLAAWYLKWNTMFLRPEALGIEIERVYRDSSNTYGISDELLRNPVIEAVRSQNGNALLTQAYPEGAPLHPATPSEHAAIAGACVTVLKFFFNTKHELDVYEPNHNGIELEQTGYRTTVGDELNKLASNMAFGRNWAGIHYSMDAIRGLKLGEKVAVNLLKVLIQRYPQKIEISFLAFSGKMITI